jgi:hypothetical protein
MPVVLLEKPASKTTVLSLSFLSLPLTLILLRSERHRTSLAVLWIEREQAKLTTAVACGGLLLAALYPPVQILAEWHHSTSRTI